MRRPKSHQTMKTILAIILIILILPFAACQIGDSKSPSEPNNPTASPTPSGSGTPTKKPTPNVTPIPPGKIVNLMATLKANPDVKAAKTDEDKAAILNDFTVRLIRAQLAEREKNKENNKNFLLSPYVMQSVLAMVANGAGGDTLTEMLAVLGGEALTSGHPGGNSGTSGGGKSGSNSDGAATADATLRALNELILGTRRDSERELQQLFISGSIWYRTDVEDFRINPNFLQTNADYFGIPSFGAPFNDDTVKAVNDLIDKQTKGLIKEIIKEFKDENRVALFSTLLFEAKWLHPFAEAHEQENWFTNIDGQKQSVRAMWVKDEIVFEVKGGQATLRPYEGENYAMLLILPDEGTLPTDLLKSWTADDWYKTIMIRRKLDATRAYAAITLPAFTFGTDKDNMIPALEAIGMELVFDEGAADLSSMGSVAGNLYVSELEHKAKIVVNEQGTIAAAVGSALCSNVSMPQNFLTFDRPFAYAIVDLNTGVPYFIGVMNSIDETPPPTIKD
ncbi:MAG: hypothetical protein GX907_01665 [Clostridiaceae bacterium]|nr:hypothetical protein [Clostridiaceae bacterium]